MAGTKPPTQSPLYHRPRTDRTDRGRAIADADLEGESTGPGTYRADGDTDKRAAAPAGLAKRPSSSRRTGQGFAPPLPPVPLAPPPMAQPAVSSAPASSNSRLATQLGRILKRKREQIQLSLQQIASLTGIAPADITSYESGGRTPYDHAFLLARVLGIPPLEMPGMRGAGDSPVRGALTAAMQGLSETVRLRYRCEAPEEHLDGPVDALKGVTEFCVEIADDNLLEYPRGTLLGFVKDRGNQPFNDPGVVLAHHWRSRVMTLRRIQDHLLVGLHPEVPSYHLDKGAWEILGRLAIVLHPNAA